MTATGLRRSLLAATSVAAITVTAPALAQEVDESQFRIAPDQASVVNTPAQPVFDTGAQATDFQVENYRKVVPGVIDPNLPAPAGVLDNTGVNGIGQMLAASPTGGFGLCTGSLVNPRMVIFAAHCVNSRAADSYGNPTGGSDIAFGFNDDTLGSFIGYLNAGSQTLTDQNVYNVEHIWYDERSLAEGSFGFLQADIAIATLDTPAFDIPKWALLFTPLSGQEHVTVTGYGRSGNGFDGDTQGIDWRRRAGENFVSFLGSFDDRNTFLFGQPFGDLPQELYWTSFSDQRPYDPSLGQFDFGIWGADDVPLPRESSTAGGDSGGPLIVDQKWDTPVVAGVLSGGSRFFGAQVFSSFGTVSFYQPLHTFWQVIVANNPYTFATTKGGDGNWSDSRHWVRQLDPSYMVEIDGDLVNGVPSTLGAEISGDGGNWGDVCFLSTCGTFDAVAQVVADGTFLKVRNGPGTTNFVPNNISADPANGVRPQYFEVTLDQAGATSVRSSYEIDKFNIGGEAELLVRSMGNLSILGDYTQIGGITSNQGVISANDFLFGAGVVNGTGRFQAAFSTVGAALLAPGTRDPFFNGGGTAAYGNLVFDGNLILTSASVFSVDVNDTMNDSIRVLGALSLSSTPTDGGTLFIRRPAAAAKPVDGQSFVIARARDGVIGEFGEVVSLLGNLGANVDYFANTVRVTLEAGSLLNFVGTATPSLSAGDAAIANSFAKGLDEIRAAGGYDNLSNVFGSVDLMDPYTLASTLTSFAPSFNSEGSTMQERQSRALTLGVTDRLSLMGNAAGGSLSITGTPRAAINGSYESASVGTRLGVAGLAPSNQAHLALPEGVTGFVTGGVISSANSFGVNESAADGQRSSYFGMGIEHEMADDLHVGVAFGRASGRSNIGGDFADSELNQVAGYASYQLGGGAYVGAVGTLEMAELETTRSGFDGSNSYQLLGASEMTKLTAMAEAGVNVGLSKGLTLTPRVQMAYSNTRLSGFNELGGETALQIDDLQSEQLEARFGAKLAGHQGVTGKWSIVPQVQADYVRVVDGSDDGLTVRFAGASDVPIALPFAGGDTSWGEVRGGVQLTNGTVQFGASFETAIGREAYRDDRAMADFTVRF